MTIDKDTAAAVAQASYAAAAEFLEVAAKEARDAASAAAKGEINLAIGTALIAETGVEKARALIEAVKAIRDVG